MVRPSGIAFLLAQLGAHVSTRFSERLAELDLTPAHVGVLRVVGQNPGLNQAALAERMDTLPSKIVGLVDDLEQRGLLERSRSVSDRRNHELRVAPGATDRIGEVLSAVGAHDAEMTEGLSPQERRQLADLLGRLAAYRGLNPEAHPHVSRRPRRTHT